MRPSEWLVVVLTGALAAFVCLVLIGMLVALGSIIV
jgi:hypothetical protein